MTLLQPLSFYITLSVRHSGHEFPTKTTAVIPRPREEALTAVQQ